MKINRYRSIREERKRKKKSIEMILTAFLVSGIVYGMIVLAFIFS